MLVGFTFLFSITPANEGQRCSGCLVQDTVSIGGMVLNNMPFLLASNVTGFEGCDIFSASIRFSADAPNAVKLLTASLAFAVSMSPVLRTMQSAAGNG